MSRRQRLEIVKRCQGGALQRELAEAYGVHITTVRRILQQSASIIVRGMSPAPPPPPARRADRPARYPGGEPDRPGSRR
ncbi:helix-turn-helix domain-containing protein [Raineyella sp. W15-4]|uniref:helix-turn-helix domain-containing protein n=1 Tax=Raineyella sp. W15-4 TaxID=3081651 RepID=UPI00398A00CF